MAWLIGGGQLIVGIGLIAVWWIALRIIRGDGNRPLTSFRFVALPSILLLWFVGGFVLILRGSGLI